MKLIHQAHEGLLNLLSSKLRSSLALLGILVGTASVVAMVSGGQLATNEALKQFKTLGTDLLAVSIADANMGSTKQENTLSLADALHIKKADNHILSVAPYTQSFNTLQYENQELSGNILGVTDSLANIIHIKMAKGRFISLMDHYQQVCVIGAGLYEKIKHTTYKNPIGQQLQLGKQYFTIIGVAKPWEESSFVYANIDQAVMIPLLASTTLSKFSTINNVIIRLTPNTNIDNVQQHITTYINQHLTDKRLYFRSAKELIVRMTKQSQIFTVFLGIIGGISLLVGGIGVMNIMLVSVVERRREIGIRIAVGAKRKDIRGLFLLEAIMLAFIGGVLGVLIGSLIAYIIAKFQHWQFVFFMLPASIGFSVSVLTGIFFGFYPAHKAAQLDPIDALRSE